MAYQWGLPDPSQQADRASAETVMPRCFTCGVPWNVSIDPATRQPCCITWWGDKHRAHFAAYCARLGEVEF